jgi:hypothetical protein
VAARTTVTPGKPELVAIPAGAIASQSTAIPEPSRAADASSEKQKEPSYTASMAVVGLLLAAMVVVAFKRFV